MEQIHFVLVAHYPLQGWKILIVTPLYSPRKSDWRAYPVVQCWWSPKSLGPQLCEKTYGRSPGSVWTYREVCSIYMDGKHLQNWGWCDRKQEAGMYFFKSSLIILMHPRTPLLAKNNSSAQSSQWSSEAVLLCIFTVQVTKLQWEARVMLIYNAYLYVRDAVSLLTILSSHLFQYESNPDECHSTQSVSYRQTHNCPE